MKNWILVLAVCCITAPIWAADESLPPLPGMEDFQMPPMPTLEAPVPTQPPALNQAETFPIKLEPQVTPVLNQIRTAPGAAAAAPAPVSPGALPAAPASTSPGAMPVSATPVKPLIIVTPSETYTIKAMPKGVTVLSPKTQKVTGGGALADYFPVDTGMQWSYEYLKAIEGRTDKKAFDVKCVSAKKMSNGTIRAAMEMAKGGEKWSEGYSLYNGMVEHRTTGKKTFQGDYVFMLPKPGGTKSWKSTGDDGSLQSYTAAYGSTEVNGKAYTDCLVVTEKIMKGGQVTYLVNSYYAKGVGLVSVQFNSGDMKLIPEKSIVLVNP
jgi:hypothetical protein